MSAPLRFLYLYPSCLAIPQFLACSSAPSLTSGLMNSSQLRDLFICYCFHVSNVVIQQTYFLRRNVNPVFLNIVTCADNPTLRLRSPSCIWRCDAPYMVGSRTDVLLTSCTVSRSISLRCRPRVTSHLAKVYANPQEIIVLRTVIIMVRCILCT